MNGLTNHRSWEEWMKEMHQKHSQSQHFSIPSLGSVPMMMMSLWFSLITIGYMFLHFPKDNSKLVLNLHSFFLDPFTMFLICTLHWVALKCRRYCGSSFGVYHCAKTWRICSVVCIDRVGALSNYQIASAKETDCTWVGDGIFRPLDRVEISLMYHCRTYQKFPSVDDAPSLYLSIIIPAYNEEKRLPKMLDECVPYLMKRSQSDP